MCNNHNNPRKMVSCEKIEKMLQFIATKYSLDYSDITENLAKEELLPKKMCKDFGKSEQPKEVRVWATKRTEEIAREKGVALEEITTRSGKTGLIVVADIENALKSRISTVPAEEPEKKPKVKKVPKEKKAPPPEEPEELEMETSDED